MANYNPVVINKALELGKSVLGINDLKSFQKDALTGLLQGRDVFLAYPTGSGKSAIYQLFPFVKEICDDILLGHEGTVPTNYASKYMALVVQPLISLMKDQITSMQQRNISAARLQSEKELQSKRTRASTETVEDDVRKCTILLASPEAVLETHRELFKSDLVQDRIVCVCIDESHCIVKW